MMNDIERGNNLPIPPTTAATNIRPYVPIITDDDTPESMYRPKERPNFLRSLIEICILALFTLSPAIIIWMSTKEATYNFFEVKQGSSFTNSEQEFVRISLFLFLAMAAYQVIAILVPNLPRIIFALMRVAGVQPGKNQKRHATYFIAARTWITLAGWVMAMGVLGAVLVYRTNMMTAMKSGLLGKTPSPADKAVSNIKIVQDQWFYIERAFLTAITFALFWGLAKYLVEFIKIAFHRMAFEDRVTQLNFRFENLTRLVDAMRSGKVMRYRYKDRDVHLSNDKKGDFMSEEAARALAVEIFDKLATIDRDFIMKEDLHKYVSPSDVDTVFGILDYSGSGDPDRTDIRRVVMEVFHSRDSCSKSIKSNDVILNKLDSILLTVALFLTFTFSVPIFSLSASAVFVVFGLVWTTFGFLFQNTAKAVFESFIFVFVEHAYDVGDRVIIDGEFLTVSRVEIFTTVFTRWDGTAVYIPNTNLAGKNIYNIRRSGPQSDTLDVVLVGATAVDKIWQLRDVLARFARSETQDFTGKVDISNFEVISGDPEQIKIKMTVQYQSNFQDAALRANRSNKFMAVLKQSCTDLEIEYFP